jgi:hypothetical protein
MKTRYSKVWSRITITGAIILLSGCASQKGVELIPSRKVPYPLELSSTSIRPDSLVRSEWLTRATFRDPLAGGEQGPSLTAEATLYGKDLIVAEVGATCGVDTVTDAPCYVAAWEDYNDTHHPDSLLRIQLRLRSTFSVNSLDTKFWDIYLRGEDGIMHEPVDIVSHEPVVVRRDSLPEPGHAPVRAGLYTRTVDLYFQIRTPFGAVTLGPEIPKVVLVMSGNRIELARFTWRVHGEERVRASRKRRGQVNF